MTFSLFHLMHTYITKILRHTKEYIIFFADLKKKGIILIHSHWKTTVVLAVFFYLFFNLQSKGKGQSPDSVGTACFKNA